MTATMQKTNRPNFEGELFATPAQRYFWSHFNRPVILQAYYSLQGHLVIDYKTKAGYFARKKVNKEGVAFCTEYFRAYDFEQQEPINYICKRNN
jgi:hypothetical protein